ncbi:hypothetical protein ACFDWB_004807 [Salmonella enterica]|nr:hypothetical protein [Salmonella enterica]EHN6577380.1 hypothetical protein [Salmonella enterica subsp. enterica serovar Anecho]EKO0906219.1 hypothetical protein [Salmonella enterica subsp. enterica]EGA2426497.1 hypothetical protein [Salmonella enterica]EGD2776801.1 hypothetical protein [Salmonella enterica]
MRKNDFIRIGIAFIITSALIAFINLSLNFEVDNQLDVMSFTLSMIFGLLGLLMTIYGVFRDCSPPYRARREPDLNTCWSGVG